MGFGGGVGGNIKLTSVSVLYLLKSSYLFLKRGLKLIKNEPNRATSQNVVSENRITLKLYMSYQVPNYLRLGIYWG